MKKILVLLFLILVIGTQASALGIGASFGYDYFGLPGTDAMLSLKLDQFPLLFGIGISIWNGINFGLTADYWLMNPSLFNIGDIGINWYFGPGLFAGIASDMKLGLRVPIGLNTFLMKQFEFFIEASPTIGLRIGNNVLDIFWGVGNALGFRFWF